MQVPEWVREAVQDPTLLYWKLCKCLPGQRAAALEWNKHFAKLCEEYGFEAYQGGTLFRHKSCDLYLSVHIDDIVLVGTENEHRRFKEHFEKILTLKSEGPYGMERPGVLYYLKRQISFDSEGVEISVNPKDIPKLTSLLKLQDKRARTIPTHSTLDVCSPDSVKEEEMLSKEEAKIFRSALGICVYISQERADVQFAVRMLASFMSNPTKNSMNALKKLASYLQWTGDMCMRFERATLRSNVFGRWHHVTNEGQRLKRSYNIELFSDSDWATSKVSRKSTSAGLIFLNGHCIHSHSRAQASIALSSMEAEVLAATGLLAEGVCIKHNSC